MWEMRTRDFAFVSLCYGRSGEEICTGYAMAASGRMQYDYKQTNKHLSQFQSILHVSSGPMHGTFNGIVKRFVVRSLMRF